MSIRTAKEKLSISYIIDPTCDNKEDPRQRLFGPKQARREYTYQDIQKLIGYIVNDGMSVAKAATKANMAYGSGYKYYKKYSQEPNYSILMSHNQKSKNNKYCSQDQIKRLVDYIVNDKMSIQDASVKAGMNETTGRRYYRRYLNDPNHRASMPASRVGKRCTPEQVNALIGCIVNDNMSVEAASIKSNMDEATGRRYYYRYVDDPNHDIPLPSVYSVKPCTQAQIKELIDYIVKNKMSVEAASRKVKMATRTARKYYYQYLSYPNHDIPMPAISFRRPCTQQQVTELINHIVKDKMSIEAASIKVEMNRVTARKHYRNYLKDPSYKVSIPAESAYAPCTQEQIKELIEYIDNDNISIDIASRKVKMGLAAARRYYHQYVSDPNQDIPMPENNLCKPCTQEQVNELISYIVNDNISVEAASLKTRMSVPTARKYYLQYSSDRNHNIPVPSKNYGKRYSQEKVKELIGYLVDDKMTVLYAAIKAKISVNTARKYYRRYINDPVQGISMRTTSSSRKFTQEKTKTCIGYIVNDKMPLEAAARKANIAANTARKYYLKYLNDREYQMSITQK